MISPNQETFEMSNVYTGNSFELFKKDQESAYAQILNNYEKFKYVRVGAQNEHWKKDDSDGQVGKRTCKSD